MFLMCNPSKIIFMLILLSIPKPSGESKDSRLNFSPTSHQLITFIKVRCGEPRFCWNFLP